MFQVCIQSLYVNGEQIFNGPKTNRAHFWFDDHSSPGCHAYNDSMEAKFYEFQNRKILYSGCNIDGKLKYFNDKEKEKGIYMCLIFGSSSGYLHDDMVVAPHVKISKGSTELIITNNVFFHNKTNKTINQ